MKSLKSIAIVWEQLAWGGVDTFLKYLLNSKNFSHLDVTIFTNDTNKGLDRFIAIQQGSVIDSCGKSGKIFVMKQI